MISALALAGCMGSPTYGTGTPAHEQLLSDVTGVLSIAPNTEKPKIDYKPRPELVKPAPGAGETLPPPQQSIATTANAAWPESPEQRRQRVLNEATAAANEGRDSPIQSDITSKPGVTSAARFGERGNFEVEPDTAGGGRGKSQGITSAARFGERGNFESREGSDNQREDFNKRLAENRQGSPTTRKYLSEPPLDYRQPAATAPTGDVGEDEWKKDRRQKKSARKGSSWADWIPGL
jgi:hypothetical protein